VVSYVTEDMKATIVIASMVLLSTLLRFVQEGRSNRAAARSRPWSAARPRCCRTAAHAADAEARASTAAAASRRAARVPLRELVPGDIVLSAGDMIPPTAAC
jgi:Mg2+-importing ATPase